MGYVMNITADNFGHMFNYLLELTIILYTLKNILLIALNSIKNDIQLLHFLLLWLFYTFLADFPLPYTFIILPVSLLIFAENPLLKSSCNVMLAFLYLNIICAICVSFVSINNVMFSVASGNTFTQTTSCFFSNYISVTFETAFWYLIAGLLSELFYPPINVLGAISLLIHHCLSDKPLLRHCMTRS